MKYRAAQPWSIRKAGNGAYLVEGSMSDVWGPFETKVKRLPVDIWVPPGMVALLMPTQRPLEEGWLAHQRLHGSEAQLAPAITNLAGRPRHLDERELFEILVLSYHDGLLEAEPIHETQNGIKVVKLSGTVQRAPKPKVKG